MGLQLRNPADLYSNLEEPQKMHGYIHSVFPLFLHGETLFCIMGKHTVEHMLQGWIQYAQQNNQIKHENYGLNKEFRAGKHGNNRVGWKPGMLSWRFQNINSSSKPLGSF